MKFSVRTFLLVLVASLAMRAAARAADETKYEMKGKYYDTCACAVSCSCGANVSLPTEGRCDGIVLIHIDQGKVGAVNLDGLNFAVVLRTPQGEKVGDAFDIKGETDLLTLWTTGRHPSKRRRCRSFWRDSSGREK